jgi:competence protein ComEC
MQQRSVDAWLPWHVYLLGAALGLLGPSAPWAASACVALAWFAGRGLGLDRLRAAPLLACFVAGWLAAAATAPTAPQAPGWMMAREKVVFTGRVVSVRGRPGERLQAILQDVEVRRDGGAQALAGGAVWTWDHPARRLTPGDTVRMRERLKPVRGFCNPGGWDFESYWLRRGAAWRVFTYGEEQGLEVRPETPSWPRRLREALGEKLRRALPDNQGGAMLMALLMGERFHLDHEVVDRVRMAGLSHTMALSGLHLGYMAALGAALAWLVGALRPGVFLNLPRRKLAVLAALPLGLVYLWLGQATPSLMRAALMLGILALLLWRDRDRVLLDGLFIAVGLMLAVDPQGVHDLRLQLSALAVLGIAVFMRPLLGLVPELSFPGGRVVKAAWSVLAVSLAANIGILPLAASIFGKASPNLWLNVFWLPALGTVVLPLGFVGLGLVALPGAFSAGAWLLSGSAWAMQGMLDVLAWLEPRVLLEPASLWRPLWPEMAGYALALAVLAANLRSPRRVWWAGAGLALALAAGPALVQAYKAQVQGVSLSLLDVGQGQAAVVEAPGGKRILVDAGGFHSDRFDAGEALVGPWLALGKPPVLETAVISHPDLDHSRGLPFLLERFGVERMYFNGDWPEGEDRSRLESALRKGGASVTELSAGDRLDLGRGAVLEVLHPRQGFESADSNERSLVLRLAWRGRGLALLPGDIGERGVRVLLDSGRDLRAEVLVLPHHGSKGSASAALYKAVDPEMAACSAGFLNQFHFPSRKARQALQAQGTPLYVTGEEGLLRFSWRDPEAPVQFEAPMAEVE